LNHILRLFAFLLLQALKKQLVHKIIESESVCSDDVMCDNAVAILEWQIHIKRGLWRTKVPWNKCINKHDYNIDIKWLSSELVFTFVISPRITYSLFNVALYCFFFGLSHSCYMCFDQRQFRDASDFSVHHVLVRVSFFLTLLFKLYFVIKILEFLYWVWRTADLLQLPVSYIRNNIVLTAEIPVMPHAIFLSFILLSVSAVTLIPRVFLFLGTIWM
jgi:hypothetical protein